MILSSEIWVGYPVEQLPLESQKALYSLISHTQCQSSGVHLQASFEFKAVWFIIFLFNVEEMKKFTFYKSEESKINSNILN